MGRITLAGLLLLIVFCGVAFAALAVASEEWACLTYTLALALFGLAAVGAVVRRGEPRTFWLGFAIFSGGYLYECAPASDGWSPFAYYRSTWQTPNASPPLITRGLVRLARGALARPLRYAVGQKLSVRWGPSGTPYPATLVSINPEDLTIKYDSDGSSETVGPERVVGAYPEYFVPVAHNLLTPLIGMIGGLAACWLHRDRQDPQGRQLDTVGR
jgi:hypothetical protein